MDNFFLGCDVSKGYADFILLDNDKNIIEDNFQLDDTFIGHNNLCSFLTDFYKQHPNSSICSAVESTGGYENNWFNTISKLSDLFNISIVRLNPLGVSHNQKALLNRAVTDQISAKNIAEYLINHKNKINFSSKTFYASLRKQWIFIKLLVKQKVQLLNQLESIVYSANPEVLSYCKHSTPNWVLLLLKQYPTAKRLARAQVASLVKIPYITRLKAESLIAKAKLSVASSNDQVTESIIKATVEQILHLHKTISLHEKQMSDSCNLPEVNILESFNGIATYSAVGLILEIGAIERFPSPKHLASFFGLHPTLKSSGDGFAFVRMSKKGRREPRLILFNIARTAINSNPLIKEIYTKHLAKGMPKMAAIGCVMHKIIRIIFGMLKHNQIFDPNIDKQNQANSKPKSSKVKLTKVRRFQNYDAQAPVSRRQNIKRKEEKKSQILKLQAEHI
ncbi:MAG: transposase [Erysipelotrichaceae bacterium]|nr:transposase [Erysipelotrichaceae bacterium]